jgi:hypothetical protein
MVSESICCDVGKTDLPLIKEDIYHPGLKLVVTMSFRHKKLHSIKFSEYFLGNAILICFILHCKMLNGFFFCDGKDVDATMSSFYSVLNDVFPQ